MRALLVNGKENEMRGQRVSTTRYVTQFRSARPKAGTLALALAVSALMLVLPAASWGQLSFDQGDFSASSATLHGTSFFGLKLAMNSSLVAIAAPYESVGGVEAAGVVYVFNNDGTLWYSLPNPQPSYHSYFGMGLAMNDDMLLIGASHADHVFPNSGVVHMFSPAGVAVGDPVPNPGTKSFFGREIEIGADGAFYVAAIGGSGEVYKFAESTGPITSTGVASVNNLSVTTYGNPDSFNYPIFGTSLAVNSIGEVFVSGQKFFATGGVIHRFDNISSYQSSIPVDGVIGLVLKADDVGSVYAGTLRSGSTGMFGDIHVYDAADQLQMVIDGPGDRDNFGASLAILGDSLVVGAPSQEVAGAVEAGCAYVFDRNTGALQDTLVWPGDPAAPSASRFGQEVEAEGPNLLVSAPYADTDLGQDAGEVFAFTDEVRYCDRPIEDFDNVFVGTDGDDVIVGTNDDDLILLLGGDDLGRGRKGDDCILGGPGNDLLRGGGGQDGLSGDEGSDTCRGGEKVDGCES